MIDSMTLMLVRELNKEEMPTRLFIAQIRRGTAILVKITWTNTTPQIKSEEKEIETENTY